MTQKPDWRSAMWHLYDYAMRKIDRLTCFKRMLECGLTRRQAATEILNFEREP